MGIPAIAATLLPFLPTIGKFALGLLPSNAQAVVGKVVETVKQGVAIAQPVINTLQNIQHADVSGNDISLAEMNAALSELKTPGSYEAALAAAKANLPAA